VSGFCAHCGQSTSCLSGVGKPIRVDPVYAELATLRTECDALRKDAERYRFLCDSSGREWEAFSPYQLIGQLDAAIDAAIKGTE
jgi:hypothetical protein